jgi:uncharacterized Tic20 family protein
METNNQKSIATFLHLSTLAQYFIPFGNFIFPIVIWSSFRKNAEFVDRHGRNAINFQLSIFLYTLILALIAIPVLMFTIFRTVPFRDMVYGNDILVENFSFADITGIAIVAIVAVTLFFLMKAAEFFLVIFAAVKAANGEEYQYPLTINFIGETKQPEVITTETETPTE